MRLSVLLKLTSTLLLTLLIACGGRGSGSSVTIGVLNTESGERASFGPNVRLPGSFGN